MTEFDSNPENKAEQRLFEIDMEIRAIEDKDVEQFNDVKTGKLSEEERDKLDLELTERTRQLKHEKYQILREQHDGVDKIKQILRKFIEQSIDEFGDEEDMPIPLDLITEMAFGYYLSEFPMDQEISVAFTELLEEYEGKLEE